MKCKTSLFIKCIFTREHTFALFFDKIICPLQVSSFSKMLQNIQTQWKSQTLTIWDKPGRCLQVWIMHQSIPSYLALFKIFYILFYWHKVFKKNRLWMLTGLHRGTGHANMNLSYSNSCFMPISPRILLFTWFA